jgi:hypothetical protein
VEITPLANSPDVILEDDDDESVSSEDERLMRGELQKSL